jgi:hypothetical protein
MWSSSWFRVQRLRVQTPNPKFYYLRMVCAKGREGNAWSANHSRAMVDMFARCMRYLRIWDLGIKG